MDWETQLLATPWPHPLPRSGGAFCAVATYWFVCLHSCDTGTKGWLRPAPGGIITCLWLKPQMSPLNAEEHAGLGGDTGASCMMAVLAPKPRAAATTGVYSSPFA